MALQLRPSETVSCLPDSYCPQQGRLSEIRHLLQDFLKNSPVNNRPTEGFFQLQLQGSTSFPKVQSPKGERLYPSSPKENPLNSQFPQKLLRSYHPQAMTPPAGFVLPTKSASPAGGHRELTETENQLITCLQKITSDNKFVIRKLIMETNNRVISETDKYPANNCKAAKKKGMSSS